MLYDSNSSLICRADTLRISPESLADLTVARQRPSFFARLAGNSFLKGEYRTERRMCCGTGEEMRWSVALPDARSFMKREGMVLQI